MLPRVRLCFFGDSFVHGTGDPDRLGWVGRVFSSEVTAYNLGVRRETSADVAARWHAEARARLPPEFECGLVFSFGANDCARRIERTRSIENAKRILSAARSWLPARMIGPAIIADDAGATERILELCADYAALCAELDVPYLAIAKLVAGSNIWRDEALANDGAHPGRGGYSVVANAVRAWPAWFSARADSTSARRP